MSTTVTTLAERFDALESRDNDTLFDVFVEWAIDRGLELYPAQEEAILEIFDGNHVVLNTPTGSGKSLVALAMHFYSFAHGKRSYYTSPVKALVSEKFFDLCQHFGAENVGMMTGDASINAGAPIICCTAEILASAALSDGALALIHHAVLDEFHYYGDRERGMAWQLPLLLMPQTTFLLMSATLGDTRDIIRQLEDRSGRPVAHVKSNQRPVPLEFKYSETPLLDTIEEVTRKGLTPLYIVNFSQRECADLAQSLMSMNFCSKEEKQAIQDEMDGVKFPTPYGKVIRKFLSHGVAIHHGGLLPRYRLLVEKLSQMGLLKIIAGTDTLGVGINLPIRTVLFTKLCKYDGHKVQILSVRDFKQIAGRAGRKGYDTEGLVIAQAPEHVIENIKINQKISEDPRKKKKLQFKKPPERGFVHWDEDTFNRLIESDSEALTSRFTVTHEMLLNLLQRPEESEQPMGYRALGELIEASHEPMARKSQLRRKAKMIFKSLRSAGILQVVPREERRGSKVQLAPDLQHDFSIHHALSLFLVWAAEQLNPEAPEFHLTLLSFVEAILEDPHSVLNHQKDKVIREAIAQMKAEGIEYEERMEKLEKITYPQPDADAIEAGYREFERLHPWVSGFEPSPKSVARDMVEHYSSFNDYVNKYGLERSEGILLRHLTQTYKTLKQNVPDQFKTDGVYEVTAYLRDVIARADSSLIQEWESMRYATEEEEVETGPQPLDADTKAFTARVRAELRSLVQEIAADNLEEAVGLVRNTPEHFWTPMKLERALAGFFEEYDHIVFNHRARATDLLTLRRVGPGQWSVVQVLVDPEDHNEWFLRGHIDVRPEVFSDPDERLFVLEEIGS